MFTVELYAKIRLAVIALIACKLARCPAAIFAWCSSFSGRLATPRQCDREPWGGDAERLRLSEKTGEVRVYRIVANDVSPQRKGRPGRNAA